MKRLLLLLLLAGCTNESSEKKGAENELDAARNFIDAALKGQWKAARGLLIPDSTNMQLLDIAENNYRTQMSPADKRDYSEASINMYSSRKIDDSSTVVHYSNSFMNKKDSLKVVRKNDAWLIDLKYSYFKNRSNGE